MIDQTLTELEDGFRDLLAGVLATVKVLRDENAVLRAQRDELRLLHGVRAEAAPTPAPILHVVQAMPRREVTRACARCKVPSVMHIRARFCDACAGLQRTESLRRCRDAMAVKRAAGEAPDSDDDERLIAEVDARIGAGR